MNINKISRFNFLKVGVESAAIVAIGSTLNRSDRSVSTERKTNSFTYSIETSAQGSVRIKDNEINIASLSPSSNNFNIKSGKNLVSAADNRISGKQIDVLP